MNFKTKRLKERLDKILQAVKKDNPLLGYDVARYRIKTRWPEAEPYIMKYAWNAVDYANDVIGGRWPEAEQYILQDPGAARYYAVVVLKHRWPEAEPYIRQNADAWFRYKHRFDIKDEL
jgi:hypothetical protein